ncbi:MAG: DUF4252 domain-containing protein [Bacteroidota bacterium]
MKKLLPFLVWFSMCTLLQAQDNIVSNYFSQYEKDPAFESTDVTQKTFALLEEVEAQSEEEKGFLKALGKLDGIKVLHKEKTKDAEWLYQEVADKIRKDGRYEDLIVVQDESDRIMIVLREEEKEIRELVLVIGEKEESFLLITIFGEIDLENITNLAGVMQSNGAKWSRVFQNIDSDELVFGPAGEGRPIWPSDDKAPEADFNIEVFPNPAEKYVRLIPTDAAEAVYDLEFFSLLGESVKQVGKVSLPYRLEVEDLPSGAYFLRLTNTAGQFRNYRIVKP